MSEQQQQAQKQDEDLEAAMREAVAAVEEVERKRSNSKTREARGDEPEVDLDLEAMDDDGVDGEAVDGEVARLKKEILSLKDISMRTLADFDNYRKRVDRERVEQKRYALVDPLREFLPVVDNLERALSAGGSLEDLRLGLEMVHRQMLDLLERFGAKPVPAEGEPFDPNIHDAVSRVEDPQVEAPTVQAEMQKGYILHERLLRPAMVAVAMPPAAAPTDEAASPESGAVGGNPADDEPGQE
jgi:molecular chaperone GrpE